MIRLSAAEANAAMTLAAVIVLVFAAVAAIPLAILVLPTRWSAMLCRVLLVLGGAGMLAAFACFVFAATQFYL